MSKIAKYLFLHRVNKKSDEPKTDRFKGVKKILLLTIFLSLIAPFVRVKAALHPVAGLVHAVATGIAYIILLVPLVIAAAFAKLSSTFMQHALDPNFFPVKFTQLTTQSGSVFTGVTQRIPTFVGTGWGISRDLAYMIIVLALIAAGLGVALRVFEAQKILASIIIAAIVIPFTPLLCGLIIDPANILTNTFLQSGATTNITSFTKIIQGFGEQVHNTVRTMGPSGAEAGLGSEASGPLIKGFVYVLAIVMIAVAMFIYGILFIVRGVVLFFLVIFSPLAIVASIFPYTKKWFSQWLQQLVLWAFVSPIAVFFLYLTGEMINSMYSQGVQSLGLGNFAYFFIPPITMYAGLAAISAAGPTGSKQVVGAGKRLLGQGWKGTKWGWSKFSGTALGKKLSSKLQGAGGETEEKKSLKATLAERRGFGKVTGTIGWGFRRGLNWAGNKMAETGAATNESQKEAAKKLVNAIDKETNGNVEEMISRLAQSAQSNPFVAMELYNNLKKKGKINYLTKHSNLLNRTLEVLTKYDPDEVKKSNMHLMFNEKLQDSVGQGVKDFTIEEGWKGLKSVNDKVESTIGYFNPSTAAGESLIEKIIRKHAELKNVDTKLEEKDISKEQKNILHEAGINVRDLVNKVNQMKGDLRGTRWYNQIKTQPELTYRYFSNKFGVEELSAKDINNGYVDKKKLANPHLIKGLVEKGDRSSLNAAADYGGGKVLNKILEFINNNNPGNISSLREGLRHNKGLLNVALISTSPFFNLVKDNNGDIIKTKDQLITYINNYIRP